MSPFRVTYAGTAPDPGFYSWAYGRAAVIADAGSVMLGLSAACRTRPFPEGFGISGPMEAGLEVHWLMPGTGIYLTGIVSGEFDSPDNYYINAGGGIGIIY